MEERIRKTRRLMEEKELDGLLIDAKVSRFYLTGFTGTAGQVLFTPEENYFITDFRYTEQAKQQTSGFEILEVNQKKLEKIAEILRKDNVRRLGFESETVSYHKYIKYRESFEVELIPTDGLIAGLRVVKDKDEVERIKEAVAIADKAFEHICNYIKPGLKEKEVALELEYFMKREGAEKNSFDFIVASGTRSSLPHGVASDKEIQEGDFITMDFGCVYRGYCSDLTRTVVLGKPTAKQEKIYNIVLKAQEYVIENIKAGMSGKEADALGREIIKEAGYGDNFGHGLGHGLGIEIHEKPRVSHTSKDILKPGMVVTDEPGIYIPGWGGVRIEDDLLITEDGCEVLSKSPKELISL